MSRGRLFVQSNDTLDALLTSIRGIGHPELPLLHPGYAPNSRVPCTDLIPFITQCIASGDITSIQRLLHLLVHGNLESDIVNSWPGIDIERTLSVSFEKYVGFDDSAGLTELKAWFALAVKDGGGVRFKIIEAFPSVVGWATLAFQPTWSSELLRLVLVANSWMDQLSAEFPETLWVKRERYQLSRLPSLQLDKSLASKMRTLSPSSRVAIFHLTEKGGDHCWQRCMG